MSRKKIHQKIGNVVAIPLGDGTFSFGRILNSPLVAFYDLRRSEIPELEEILRSPIAFSVWVMKYAVTDGDWPVIGNAPLEEELLEEPLFFKKDIISGVLSIYQDNDDFIPATKEQCKVLERAAVWDRCHIVDRLNDHFAGRPNQWVESLRP
jgi:hypothetical protein